MTYELRDDLDDLPIICATEAEATAKTATDRARLPVRSDLPGG